MFKNIIFDWSGVINDSVRIHLLRVNYIFKNLGLKKIGLIELRNNWQEPYIIFYRKYLPGISFKKENILYKKASAKYYKTRPFPGIVKALKDFKKQGIKMAVLSADHEKTLMAELDNFGLKNVFADIVTDAHDKSKRLEQLIKKNNFKKNQTIFIGDSNHDIEVSRQAGIKIGSVTWGFCAEEKLKAWKPDYIIKNLRNLKSIILS